MKTIFPLLFLALAACAGCGGDAKETPEFKSVNSLKVDRAPAQGQDGQQAPVDAEENQPRKIIYRANVEMVVDDLEKAEQELNQILNEQGGYVAKSEVRGSPGSPRSGTWTVRVPVEHFPVFMEAAGKLGELRRSSTDSDDITDKYFDLKAHLKNNQVEEEGLRKLLLEKSAGGKLDDILAIRKELRGIRGDIEQQQGQIQR